MRRAIPIALVVAVLTFGALSIFVIPNHLVHKDLVPSGTDRAKLRHDERATLLQSLLGLLILVGGYMTWQQVRVTREGQITDRFTKAIDQLGNKDKELDVRLGGIYALGRIAKDSPADQRTIEEILAAYARAHSPWPPRLPGQYQATAPILELPIMEFRAPDIQAVMQVLALTELKRQIILDNRLYGRLPLYSIDLRNLVLFDGSLDSAILTSSNLTGALLDDASFKGAYLNGSRFEGAELERAKFHKATLRQANLRNANLKEANLREADLSYADLRGADLSRADLSRTVLWNTRADSDTSWPEGFDPSGRGIVLE
jgi:hypothetical protein